MSRSQPNDKPINPSSRFFEWNGQKGVFKFYEKEKKENFEVPFPFIFLVLDELSTIKGWSDSDQSGLWSNEVKNIKNETLAVRSKKGLQIEGTYENIKGKVSGADYCKSVYIAYKNDAKELVIGNIAMQGACLNAWIEFSKGKKVQEGAVRVEDTTEGKKGSITYKMPNFVQFTPKPETEEAATGLDVKLQEYLKAYFNHKVAETEVIPTADEVEATFTKGAALEPSNEFMNPEGKGVEKLPEDSPVVNSQNSRFPDDF